MSALAASSIDRVGPIRSWFNVLFAAARFQNIRWQSNIILIIRRPLNPLLYFLSIYLAFRISGQTSIPKEQEGGFLVIGALAVQAWSASIWASGFGLQSDAYDGTLPSILASPSSRTALVCGYGLGDLYLSAPSTLLIALVGWIAGAQYAIASWSLAIFGFLSIFVATLCIGVACAGLFILSRNANPLANFLQTPVYLVAGIYFPRSILPDWASFLGALLPITHALRIFRAATLERATWGDVQSDVLKLGVSTVLVLLIGLWSLRRVDYELRKTGSLNLF